MTPWNAVWGKGESGALKHIKNIENPLSFLIIVFNSDNRGEFLNQHLFR
jgi:hypothetical protein